jgi:hypothetical protein
MLIPTVFRILEAHSPSEPVEKPAESRGEFAQVLAEQQAALERGDLRQPSGEIVPTSPAPIETARRALVDSIRSLEAVENAAQHSKLDIFE